MCGGMTHHPVDLVWQSKIREAIKRHGMYGGMTHHPVDLVWQSRIREAIKRHGMDDLSNKDDKNGGAKKE